MASLPEDTLHQTTPASPHAGSAQMLDFHLSPSVISSRMTNIISEDGDAYRPEGPAGAAVQSQARVSAEGSTRPASSQPEPWNSSSTARHGLVSSAGSGNGRGINAFGGPGVSMSNSSRPQSAVSRVSRISRTHVPSVASRAFFRPMSSQRLQAQRGGRTLTSDQSLEARDGTKDIHDSKSSTNPRLDHVDRGLPPPSAGTDITEDDPRDRTSANASPTGTATIWSAGKSTRLLHSTFSQPRQPHHHTVPDYRQEPGVAPQNPKPNVSFRSNFLLPIRRDPQISTRNDRDRNIHAASDTLFSRPDKEIVPPHAHDRTNRNHHYFSGNTAFIWGGRLQNTREKPINVATGTLVVLPCILFLIFSAPYLWHNVSPAIPIFFAYNFYICISSFLHGSVTDPGILPRELHALPALENEDDPLTIGPSLADWAMIKPSGWATTAMEVPINYCKTCSIWRPPRGHHCRICDNCIEAQDHHCVWLNNCVGRRNYRYFFTFVTSGTFLGIFLVFASLGHCLHYQSASSTSFGEALNVCRVPFALFIFGILITPYPAGLMGYHLFLMGQGETTREYLNSHKFLKKDRHRPFDQGSTFANWVVVFFRPRPPTYLRFHDKHEEGDQRFGSRREKIKAQRIPTQHHNMEMRIAGHSVDSFQEPATRADV